MKWWKQNPNVVSVAILKSLSLCVCVYMYVYRGLNTCEEVSRGQHPMSFSVTFQIIVCDRVHHWICGSSVCLGWLAEGFAFLYLSELGLELCSHARPFTWGSILKFLWMHRQHLINWMLSPSPAIFKINKIQIWLTKYCENKL